MLPHKSEVARWPRGTGPAAAGPGAPVPRWPRGPGQVTRCHPSGEPPLPHTESVEPEILAAVLCIGFDPGVGTEASSRSGRRRVGRVPSVPHSPAWGAPGLPAPAAQVSPY